MYLPAQRGVADWTADWSELYEGRQRQWLFAMTTWYTSINVVDGHRGLIIIDRNEPVVGVHLYGPSVT